MMARLIVLLGLLLGSTVAHANLTYRCRGTGVDTANLNTLSAKVGPHGDYIHVIGNCDPTGTATVTIAGTILYGDGPANVPVADAVGQGRQTASGLPPTAQTIAASTGPATVFRADVQTMRTTPFSGFLVTASPAYIGFLSYVGNYSQIAAVGTPGLNSATAGTGFSCMHNAGTVFNLDGSVASLGGITFDHLDSEDVGGSHYYFYTGKNCGIENSVGRGSWGSSVYDSNSTQIINKILTGQCYVTNSVFTDASKSTPYGSGGIYYDMIGWDPNHACFAIGNSILGGDILHSARPNTNQSGGPDFDVDNYHDNSSTVHSCDQIGLAGIPPAGDVFSVTQTMSRPAGASTVPTISYQLTSADAASSDPLGAGMAGLQAAVNVNPLTAAGTTVQLNIWTKLHSAGVFSHFLDWRFPSTLSCQIKATFTDSFGILTQQAGNYGNGSGGCSTHNGVSGPSWSYHEYCRMSAAYCEVIGGATVSVHSIANVCDGATDAGYKVGSGVTDGSPNGAENGVILIGNKNITPNIECDSAGCAGQNYNAIYATVSSTCGSWVLRNTPAMAAGETLALTISSPGASNSPQTVPYTVTAADMAASSPISAVANHISSAYNFPPNGAAYTPLISGGAPITTAVPNEGNKSSFSQITFKNPLPCSESLSYTDSTGAISIVNSPSSSNVGTVGAFIAQNLGGNFFFPPASNAFTQIGNVSGNYP